MGMTANCAARMRQGGCGDCARVSPCRALFAQLFGRSPPPRRNASTEARAGQPSPLLALLGQIGRAIETSAGARPATASASSFRREVERQLEPLLELGAVRIEAVAAVLGCSRQTLYRRLKAEGVTFAALLDSLRHRLALVYVRERGLPVKEAAWRLGFSEPAAFSRAYKRWTGASPRRMNG